ncbi:2367_t:CDS:2, partial [Racocetra fulgida]
LWSQGIRYEENIPDDIQIEDYYNIQFNDNDDSIQVDDDEKNENNDEFNENSIQNLLQSENNDEDMLEITEYNMYILECQYGRLNEHYLAIKLVPITGTFREFPELVVISNAYVSAREAAIQQSSESITATKCLCKGDYLKNYCKCKK